MNSQFIIFKLKKLLYLVIRNKLFAVFWYSHLYISCVNKTQFKTKYNSLLLNKRAFNMCTQIFLISLFI